MQQQQHKEILLGKTPEELAEAIAPLGMKAYVGKQLAYWLYRKQATDFEQMHNISKVNREKLAAHFDIGRSLPMSEQQASDGTKKYLYRTANGRFIEAAMIPEKERKTLCLSSQIGCKMACEFCATGKQKFHGHLSAADIVNQLLSLPEYADITNLVYMGMGEPMDNYEAVKRSIEIFTSDWGLGMSPRRINVSTVGILPTMKRFLDETEAHLAISLHSPFDAERLSLMPVQGSHPIREVIRLLKSYDWSGQRRVSFEYIVFEGINHSPAHVKELARLLNGLRCRVNLIRFHRIPDTRFDTTSEHSITAFRDALRKKGLLTTIRASRGQDIDAACGLLSTKALMKQRGR